MNKYSTKRKEKIVLAAVVAALLIMAGAWILLEKAEARAWAPDEVFPMANSRIQWTGAGFRR